MSLNLDFIKPYCDHPDALEEVYDVALTASRELPEEYIFLETGTRSGGSALAILQAIKDSGRNRWLFTIDPYGLKPYKVGNEVVTLDYDEDHYRRAMKVLADYAYDHRLLWSHFRLKSVDFMRYFHEAEFWYNGRPMQPSFGFAYLDGDHDTDTVEREYSWLSGHSEDVRVIVDDAHYLERRILKLGETKNNRLFIGVSNERGTDTPTAV